MKCVRKEQYECIYLTKQNREEVLKIFEPNIDGEHIFIKEDNDRHCIVEHLGWYRTYYFYNRWYVLGLEDYTWNCYTDEEFKEEGNSNLEHIWFKVEKVTEDSITGVLIQEPYYIKNMHEGSVGTYPTRLITDWKLYTDGQVVSPDDVYLLKLP